MGASGSWRPLALCVCVIVCATVFQCAFVNATSCGAALQEIRAKWTPLLLQPIINTLIFALVLQSFDKLLLVAGCFYIWFKQWIKKGGRSSTGKVMEGGEEKPAFEPVVLVQIPMRNERECYKRIIMAACRLDWPQDKLVIQILEDLDDAHSPQLVQDEVDAWRAAGARISLRRRTNRTGFKAGALALGMRDPAVQHCEYVAIFDADFVPARDFLRKTVPKFEGQPKLALVQARWECANAHQNLLTRFQAIGMAYHFEVEQQVQGEITGFFGFNGTAGVWRIRALEDAGGWLARTTVEDMDLSVRAHMRGWKFTFLNDVTVPSEVPCTYQAYCKQQYRWHAGGARLLMLTWRDTLTCPTLSLYQKFNLLVCFYGNRRVFQYCSAFLFYSILTPLFAFVPEAVIPHWFPIFMHVTTVAYAIPHHKDWRLLFPYLIFGNVMCRIKAQAIFSGLLNFSSASVWVVTAKSGVDGGAEASQTGGLTGRESEGGGRDSPEPVSSASESSSEDAFVADSSVDQLIAYDLPKLSTKLRTSVGAQAELGRPGEEISGKVSPRCGGLESPARRRDLGPVSSPLKKGLKNVVVARRTQSLTSAEERKTILPSSLVAKAAWHAKRTLYKLSVLREGWASVRTQLAARKVHVPELGMAAYMLGILAYCVGTGQSGFYFYLSTQGLGYLIVGLDLLGS